MKNVERFRKLIKKILRTICVWGVIATMVIPALAVDEIETIPLYPYITFVWGTEYSTSAYVRAYDRLDSNTVTSAGSGTNYKAILAYQSALNKDTFYHMRISIKSRASSTSQWLQGLNTGVVTQTGGDIQTLLFPANSLAPYSTQIKQAHDGNTTGTVGWSYESASAYSVTKYVGAKSYYYLTKKTNEEFVLDCVFYFDEQFFKNGWSFEASSTRYMQCYLGLILPVAGALEIQQFDLYPVGGSDYNGKLDEIISLLQMQGGGLTEEDIKEATIEALQQHEQEEQQQAQQTTQDARQQAEQAIARYTEVMDQMRLAMSGIEDITDIDTSTYTLTIGPFTNPMTGGTFPAVGIDFYTAYMQLPLILRTTCPIVVTFFVLMAYAREFLDIFRHVEKTMHGEDEE